MPIALSQRRNCCRRRPDSIDTWGSGGTPGESYSFRSSRVGAPPKKCTYGGAEVTINSNETTHEEVSTVSNTKGDSSGGKPKAINRQYKAACSSSCSEIPNTETGHCLCIML